jgi:transposase
MVMIGIDPHKRTHTAVAVDDDEAVLGEQLVHARAGQVGELMTWADAFGEPRTWAVESAGGLGYLLARQLLAAGEDVVDIPATLASRVRLLGTGRSRRTTRTTLAVVIRRSGGRRNTSVCRLHASVCELVPGGIPRQIVARQAVQVLERLEPAGAVGRERHQLAFELLDDIARFDDQRKLRSGGSRPRSSRRARRSPRCSGSVTSSPRR